MVLLNKSFIDMAEVNLAPECVTYMGEKINRYLIDQFLGHMEMGKAYAVRMDEYTEPEPRLMQYVIRRKLEFREIPVEQVKIYHEFKAVTVDQLEIESINCNNCAAPIPVGRLDTEGDTVVRCSYCGTYHVIKKKT